MQHPSLRYCWRDTHGTRPELESPAACPAAHEGPLPTPTAVSDPGSMRLFETRAGQLLYIPLGWRHKAVPSAGGDGEPSVHVTMGVTIPRWVDALEALVCACSPLCFSFS